MSPDPPWQMERGFDIVDFIPCHPSEGWDPFSVPHPAGALLKIRVYNQNYALIRARNGGWDITNES